jgi:hypothetical protein
METKLSSNVADLSAEQRQMLETLIGQPLRQDQVLLWVVASAGHQPTASDKAQARAGLQELFSKVDLRIAQAGGGQDDAEAVIDDAVRQVRSQPIE